ncbi:glutamate racemase [Verrucomicrobiales bacterium]|nr:glutamate racemase [Verrucomicrobiales bacterium]
MGLASPVIGILDSGVGGLSVLREIRTVLPSAAIHYVGDSSHCPYGTKSPEEIIERVTEIADYLLSQGAGLLVIACNSATIHAVRPLRATYPTPIVGMEPGVKPAAEQTRSGIVGVLATEASIAGEKFHQLVDTHADGVRVITRPCPKFVELVEAGKLDGSEVDAAIDEAVAPMLDAGADALVLGCTHYPFLSPAIRSRIPESVSLIDTGPAVALRVAELLPKAPDSSEENSEIHIETTGELSVLEELLPMLLPGVEAELTQSPLTSSKG